MVCHQFFLRLNHISFNYFKIIKLLSIPATYSRVITHNHPNWQAKNFERKSPGKTIFLKHVQKTIFPKLVKQAQQNI